MAEKNVYRIRIQRREWTDEFVVAESFEEARDKAYKLVGEDAMWNGYFVGRLMSGLGIVTPHSLGAEELLVEPKRCPTHPNVDPAGGWGSVTWPPCFECVAFVCAKAAFREKEKGCACPDSYSKRVYDGDADLFGHDVAVEDPSYHLGSCRNRKTDSAA